MAENKAMNEAISITKELCCHQRKRQRLLYALNIENFQVKKTFNVVIL